MQNDNNQFNPIEFLGLQLLNAKQKANIYKPILADMASFIIDAFTSQLDENQVDIFLKQLEGRKDDPIEIIKLMEETMPGFDDKKMEILNVYRENFKLQNFQNYL
jgi:hypothetical protein